MPVAVGGDGGPRARQHRRRLRHRAGAQPDPVTRRRGEQLAGAGIGDHLAAADDHQVIGHVLQFAHQVAGHQDGPALAGQRPQEPAHPDDAFGVHAVERLVHHQHRRVAEHRRRDAEPLPHAQRVAARLPPRRGLQPGLLDDRVDAAGVQALGVGQPQQVVAGGPAGLQRGRVQQRSDVGQRPAQRPVRPPADQRGALVGRVQAEDDPHRGGLARAVGADEPGDLTGLHGERHPVQGDGRPEPLAQPVDFDGRVDHATVLPRSWSPFPQWFVRHRRCQHGVGG